MNMNNNNNMNNMNIMNNMNLANNMNMNYQKQDDLPQEKILFLLHSFSKKIKNRFILIQVEIKH